MGFKNALDVWKNYLKHNGSIVISELRWFSKNPSEEIKLYFEAVYPDINYSDDNLKIIESAESA